MYSSPADVRNALTSVADIAVPDTASTFTDPQIEDAIKEADGNIDVYLGGKYSVPQDPSDTSVAVYPVRAWSRDIAAFLVTLTFRKSKDMEPDDPMRLRYQWVMDILNKIAEGDLLPNLPPPVEPEPGMGPQGAFVYNLYPGKLFTMADVFCIPGRGGPWSYVQPYRYGDIAWSEWITGSGYDEVLVLVTGQPVPPGTPDNTLIIWVPED